MNQKVKKTIVLSLMMALTIFIFTILRNAKDALVISSMGAELLSTIKLYGVLPCAFLMVLFYSRIATWLTRIQTYYFMIVFFISYFIFFAYFIYPHTEFFTLHFPVVEKSFFRYILIMINHWHYSTFYIMSELWGTTMVSLMFWQLANQITSIDDAKRLFPLFGLVAQLGMILAGCMAKYIASSSPGWGVALQNIVLYICVASMMLSILLYILRKYIVSSDVINGLMPLEENKDKSTRKVKEKLTMTEALKHVLSSKYILLITLLIVCYGVCINLSEAMWKKQVNIVYSDHLSYSYFIGNVQIWMGVFTAVVILSASWGLKKIKWSTASMITPIMVFVLGICLFFPEMSTVTFILAAGTAQQIFAKGTKYAIFDPTKEMLYIPIDEISKSVGKAAAETIGSRLGKSGGSIVQWLLLSLLPFSNLSSIAPYLFLFFCGSFIIWIWVVFSLSYKFKKVQEEYYAAN